MTLRQLIKNLAISLEIPLTKNISYDIDTKKIMKKFLGRQSNCIDIGCHKGEIMDEILKHARDGQHFAFEPLPHLAGLLKEKYRDRNITVFQVALFDKKGETTFNYVVNAPAYSGIRKRHYDIPDARITELQVDTDLLDSLIPVTARIDFIKIDVEGAELPVLKGGVNTITRCKPLIIFESGIGAADYYGVKPEHIYDFFTGCGMHISTMGGFLRKKGNLEREEFLNLYDSRKEYYFVAHG